MPSNRDMARLRHARHVGPSAPSGGSSVPGTASNGDIFCQLPPPDGFTDPSGTLSAAWLACIGALHRRTGDAVGVSSADNATQIAAEEAARIAADTALQGGLDAEAATRASNDTAEANARLAADTAEANARITADAAETSARIAADNALNAALLPKPGGGVNWSAGNGAPGANQPRGSLFSRLDGAVGSTLYVSQGGGTWNPVAGV
jgi:hypothetical protein